MICSFQSCNTDELIITYTPQLSLRTVGEYKSIDTITIEGKQYQLYNPYKFAGKYELKGNMHIHSDNSAPIDGFGSGKINSIAKKYKNEGAYDFYAITDHNYITENPNIEGIICMGNSMEYTLFDKTEHHLIIYNLPEHYNYNYIGSDINEAIKYFHSIGALVSYAHPDWSKQYQTSEKILSVENIDFVEIFNGIEGGSERAYNILLRNNVTFALGVDDYHYNAIDENSYFDKSYICVFSDVKEREAIWTSILNGAMYASTGARMNISVNDSNIELSTNIPSTFQVFECNSNSDNAVCIKSLKNKKSITYTPKQNQNKFWFKISNKNGEAISQPFYINPI